MLLIDEVVGQPTREVGHAPKSRLSISVRELLHVRVELEWRKLAIERDGQLTPPNLIPGSIEAKLNSATRPGTQDGLASASQGSEACRIDRMCAAAEQAFLDQRIFVLLDDRQAESLDEMIDVERTAAATFLLLTPLQGG